MAESQHAFVAYLPCGHAIGMCADIPDEPDFAESFYAENVGRDIRRVPIEEARTTPIYVRGCITCRNAVSTPQGERDAK